jgi:hypothetical protein
MILLPLLLQIVPLGREVPAPGGGNESWSKVAVHESGALARSWMAGNDVWLQVAGGQVRRVNTGTKGTQDEPAVAATPEGFLAAFNDRGSRDGWYMGVFARRFDVHGVPIGLDFQVNAISFGSQWRCMLAIAAGGEVAFLFSGGLDNNGFVRLMAPDGHWLTGDVAYWTNKNGEQEDPVGAWLPNGNLRVVWRDGHTWSGTSNFELAWRDLSPAGLPLGQPEALCSPALPGEQREPRIAIDPTTGEPWVTWYDAQGVWVKRGAHPQQRLDWGILPEPVPPRVVYQRAGEILVWPELVVANSFTAGMQERPMAFVGPDQILRIAWHGPSWKNATKDAYVRAFTTP